MSGKKVLVAPLDWGLGHATRCIPVVRELELAGYTVLIAADGNSEHLLREAFPHLQFIPLEGYHLSYSTRIPAWLKIFFQIPKILASMRREHSALKKIIEDHQIDIVISDNRFGMWNKKVLTVYITHQLMIKCPRGLKFFEPLLHALHKRVIGKFDRCWIPDHEGEINLSGDLSHKYPLPKNAEFIGPLSRFNSKANHDIQYDLCIILSGPEPARTSFERKIRKELEGFKGKYILILGQPGNTTIATEKESMVFSHLKSDDLEKAILSSKHVICRSGYSSIMDLVALQKNAVLIPTPGQTEQEYLASFLLSKKIFQTRTQKDFSLRDFSTESFSAERKLIHENKLKQAISKLKNFRYSSPE